MILAFAPSSQYVVTNIYTEFLIRYVKHFYSMLVKMNSLLELSIFIIAYSIKAYVIKFHISSTVLVTKYHLLDRIIPLCILFQTNIDHHVLGTGYLPLLISFDVYYKFTFNKCVLIQSRLCK